MVLVLIMDPRSSHSNQGTQVMDVNALPSFPNLVNNFQRDLITVTKEYGEMAYGHIIKQKDDEINRLEKELQKSYEARDELMKEIDELRKELQDVKESPNEIKSRPCECGRMIQTSTRENEKADGNNSNNNNNNIVTVSSLNETWKGRITLDEYYIKSNSMLRRYLSDKRNKRNRRIMMYACKGLDHPGCEWSHDSSPSGGINEIERHYSEVVAARFWCPTCDRNFSRPDEANQHRLIHPH